METSQAPSPQTHSNRSTSNAHLKAVLHLEALVLQLLHAGDLLERYITDGLFALRLGVAERVGGEAEVALLELPAEALPGCGVLGHHAAGKESKESGVLATALRDLAHSVRSLCSCPRRICTRNRNKNRANCSNYKQITSNFSYPSLDVSIDLMCDE